MLDFLYDFKDDFNDNDQSRKVLNCFQLMCRIMPLVFESQPNDLRMFWEESEVSVKLVHVVFKFLFYRGYGFHF